MSSRRTFPVELRFEGGEYEAYCSQVPEAIAGGPTEADALREMRHALVAVARGRMKRGLEPVSPGAGTAAESYRVTLPADLREPRGPVHPSE
jgi:antitoxin HicB